MKKYLALALALIMVICCFAACGGNTGNEPTEEPTGEAEVPANVIELGTSGLTITTAKLYAKGEISAEDTDENQVAYYKSEETLVDFDVYEWAKATDETLADAIAEEAKEFDAEAKETEINGIKAAYYNATEESEGKEYATVTYMIDNGDEFVEIVFWLDGENAQAEVDAIIATLAKAEGESEAADGVIALGNSGLKITPEKKYVLGEISSEDTDENQVAYYKSEETLVDFDVYEWAKATDETLADAIAEEAKEFDAEAKETEINGIKAAYYNATEESEGKEYQTVTYMFDNGDEFVEIVFWLDGENAQAEVDGILATLAK